METWRDIPELAGFYQASDQGRIRSLPRLVRSKGSGTRLTVGKVIAPGTNGRYRFFTASVHGALKTVMVQRAVCSAFHGEPPVAGMHAAHIDGNSFNNVPMNLRWATPKENCADRVVHGTQVRGTRVNTNKLSEDQARRLRARARSGECTKALAAEFGVHRSSVQQLMRGATWKHLTD